MRKARVITRGVDPIECKNDVQHLKLQSYVMLCHAAIEEYLENVCREAGLVARQMLIKDGIITQTLVGLISSGVLDEIDKKSRNSISRDHLSNIATFSEKAYNRYLAYINSNHGIVSSNQMALLLPVGVDPQTVDITVMNALDAFGMRRGDVAHKFRVRRADTLSAVESDLQVIIPGLRAYDVAVCEALRKRLSRSS